MRHPALHPVISPERSYKVRGWVLTVSAGLVHILLRLLSATLLQRLWLVITVVFPGVSVLVLAWRYVTPSRAAALRLTLTSDDYAASIRLRPILPADAVADRFVLIFIAAAFASTIESNSAEKVGRSAVNLDVRAVWIGVGAVQLARCWRAILYDWREEVEADLGKEKGEMSLEALTTGEGWVRTGLKVKRHDVWVRRRDPVEGEKEGKFEVAVSYALDHPSYRAGQHDKFVGPILGLMLQSALRSVRRLMWRLQEWICAVQSDL